MNDDLKKFIFVILVGLICGCIMAVFFIGDNSLESILF